MNIVCIGRQNGKTAMLIKKSAETGTYILVSTRNEALQVAQRAKEMGYTIPFPITLEEVKRGDLNGTYVKKVLVDNADRILQRLLGPVEIETMTLTLEDL